MKIHFNKIAGEIKDTFINELFLEAETAAEIFQRDEIFKEAINLGFGGEITWGRNAYEAAYGARIYLCYTQDALKNKITSTYKG